MRITRRSAVPLIGLGLTGAWPGSGKVYPPGAASVATPFNPTSLITGGGGFWRADVGVTGSPNVTAWADQSSFANNLSVAFGSDPTFSATGFNTSFPGITVADGTVQNLSAVLAFNSSTASVFYLLQAKTGASTFARAACITASGDTNSFGTVHGLFTGTDASEAHFAAFQNDGAVGSPFGSQAIVNNTYYLVGYVFDGANGTQWINGSVGSGHADTNSLGGAPNPTFSIGADQNSAPSNPAFGAVYAFVGLTQKAMNSTDWTNLKNWSNSNWGMSF